MGVIVVIVSASSDDPPNPTARSFMGVGLKSAVCASITGDAAAPPPAATGSIVGIVLRTYIVVEVVTILFTTQ